MDRWIAGLSALLLITGIGAEAAETAQLHAAAQRGLQEEFTEPTLMPEQQREGMAWFIAAAEP